MSSTFAGPSGAVEGVASDFEEADTLSGAANCLICAEISQAIKLKMKSLPNIGMVIGAKTLTPEPPALTSSPLPWIQY
jgi:hypothetical protein